MVDHGRNGTGAGGERGDVGREVGVGVDLPEEAQLILGEAELGDGQGVLIIIN